MEQNVELTRQEIYKRKLILRYFYEYEHLQLNKMYLKLVYSDKVILKYLLIPKRFYRTYYLNLSTPFSEEKIQVSIKDKDEIKRMLYEIRDN